MDQSELKYAIRVDERAFFIRFYCWLYEADKSKVNFCKLFWGYVFAAPALFFRGLIGGACIFGKGLARFGKGLARFGKGLLWIVQMALSPMFWLLDTTSTHRDARLALLKEQREAEKAEREAAEIERIKLANEPEEAKPGHEIMQRGLGLVEHGGTVAVMKCRTAFDSTKEARATAARATVRIINHIGEITSIPAVGRAILAFAAGLSILGIGLILFLLSSTIGSMFSGIGDGLSAAAQATAFATSAATNAVVHSEISLWAGVGLIALAMLISLIMAALAIGLPYLIFKYFLAPTGNIVAKVGTPGVRVIDGGLRGFGQIMHLGYYAVKTSTCPRIEIEERPDREKIKRLEEEVELVP